MPIGNFASERATTVAEIHAYPNTDICTRETPKLTCVFTANFAARKALRFRLIPRAAQNCHEIHTSRVISRTRAFASSAIWPHPRALEDSQFGSARVVACRTDAFRRQLQSKVSAWQDAQLVSELAARDHARFGCARCGIERLFVRALGAEFSTARTERHASSGSVFFIHFGSSEEPEVARKLRHA